LWVWVGGGGGGGELTADDIPTNTKITPLADQ
jgi:hypothetical protein